ncbi:MAG: threonine/serine dehydratase [Alphaproteobacteria bacterium]
MVISQKKEEILSAESVQVAASLQSSLPIYFHDKPLAESLSEIEQASVRLASVILETPLLQSRDLNDRVGAKIYVKSEQFQHSGSFKYRGAFYWLLRMPQSDRRKGVVCFSSGSLGIAIAAAAQMMGVKAVIFMPAFAPEIKAMAARRYSADVVVLDVTAEELGIKAEQYAKENGHIFLHAYDTPDIITAHGTVGLELIRQMARLKVRPDMVLIPCGGGALTSGVSLAMAGLSPETRVMAVEPYGFDDTLRSLHFSTRLGVNPRATSICEGLTTPMPGKMTIEIMRHYLSGSVTVNDDEVKQAMKFAFHHMKTVLEPSGAAALAAILSGAIDVRGLNIAIITTGGNVEHGFFSSCLA